MSLPESRGQRTVLLRSTLAEGQRAPRAYVFGRTYYYRTGTLQVHCIHLHSKMFSVKSMMYSVIVELTLVIFTVHPEDSDTAFQPCSKDTDLANVEMLR